MDVKLKEVLSYVGNEATELVCEVSGIPKPQVSWYKLNSEMSADAEVNEDGNLVLKNLSRDDAGAYRCVGINELGASDGLTEVRVQGKQLASKLFSTPNIPRYSLLELAIQNTALFTTKYYQYSLKILKLDPSLFHSISQHLKQES